ncbi:MAG: hypothetical protein FJ146_15570 [Deltaproteobacteria bacterium]|nr:hypothetical protein [Deltaproteobacteria bacterium]
MNIGRTLIIIQFALSTTTATAIPEWARNNATKRDGHKLATVCSGSGPSIDIARGEAIRGCKASAADFLNHSGRVHAILTETSEGVDFHQSVEDHVTFKGLTCLPSREQIELQDSGSVLLWLQCQFDLSQAILGEDEQAAEATSKPTSQHPKHLTALRDTKIQPARESISREKIVLNIASVPSCTKLVFKGPRARTVSCSGHPASVVIFPEDETVTIEAKGYTPKSLDLRSKKWKNHDAVQVILDAH